MLTIVVPGIPAYNEETEEFTTVGDVVLELEHSLVSLSKWESKHEKPFLQSTDKTSEEILDYVKIMVVTPNVSEEILSKLSEDNIHAINEYINAKMTATYFSEIGAPKTRNKEIITSELVYYWMTVFHIPFECEHWHLNRLFTLIRICSIKQEKPKKMSRSEMAARQRELNEQRKKMLGTTG